MKNITDAQKPLKDKYEFACINCGHEQFLKPSMMMSFGINSGHGSCLNCHTFLHLELNEDGTGAVSTYHSDYVDQMKKELEKENAPTTDPG